MMSPRGKYELLVADFSEDDPAYGASTFGGIGQYMSNKRIKQQNQDAAYRSLHPDAPQIFRGYTVTSLGFLPDPAAIRKLVVKHGGVWREFKDGGATVIIATMLPKKKLEEMKGKRVVRPEWVAESVKKGKAVDWGKFSLVGEGERQGRLAFGEGGGLGVASGERPAISAPFQFSSGQDELSRFLRESAKNSPGDWEIPASDDGDEEREDARDVSVRQPPDPISGEEDEAPPCAQPPPKEEYEEEEQEQEGGEEGIDDNMWLGNPTRFLASSDQRPKRAYESFESDDAVRLVDRPDTQTRDSFHFDMSLPVSTIPGAPDPSETPPPTAIIDGEPAYEVEALIGERKRPAGKGARTRRKRRQLLVKWRGYGEEEATWESEDVLRADLGDEVFGELWEAYRSMNRPPRATRGSQKKSSSEPQSSSQQQTAVFSQITKASSQSSSGRKSSVVIMQVTIGPSQDQATEKALPTGFSFLPESFSTVHLSIDDQPEVPGAATEPPSPIRSPTDALPPPSQPPDSRNPNTPSLLPLPVAGAAVEIEAHAVPNCDLEGGLPPLRLPEMKKVEQLERILAPSLPDTTAGPSIPNFVELESPAILRSARSTGGVVPQKRPAAATSSPQTPKKLRHAGTELDGPRTEASLDIPSLPKATESPRATRGSAKTAEQFNEELLSRPDVRAHSVLNPDFLPNFFKESRLHHLSTWKADLRARVQALPEQSSRPAPPLSRSVRYVLHVDFDCFFAAVSTRDRPELKDKPVAVCHGEAKSSKSSEIASCNYAARNFGVRNGMWMASARELCPGIITVDYDYDKYKQASDAFYDVALSVGGERLQAVSVDEVLLDVSNLVCDESFPDAAREEAAAQKLASQIRDECRRRTGCEVSVGIGASVLTARLALRKAKPAGQFMIPRTEVQPFLDGLQVSAFPGIGKHTVAKIANKFGSDQVSEVRKVPRERLRQTLGEKTGLKVYSLCRGVDETLVGAAESPRETISISINWGVRFYLQGQVEEFIHRLASGVEERMQIEGVRGRTLVFTVGKRAQNAPFQTAKFLGCGSIDTVNRTSAFNVPTRDAQVIARKCVELLRQFHVSPGNIRGLGIGMKGLEDASKVNGQKQLQFQPMVAIDGPKADQRARPRSAPGPQTEPELKPAAPVTVRPYVKPRATTLKDVFGKQKEIELPSAPASDAASKVAGVHRPDAPMPANVGPKDRAPPVGRELVPGPAAVLYAPPKYTTPLDFFAASVSRRRQSDVPSVDASANTSIAVHKQEDQSPPKPKGGVVQNFLQPKRPPVPLNPLPTSTQFEIPSASQIDLSVLPFLPADYQKKVLEHQRAREVAAVEAKSELEKPPDSQWDVGYWNTFSQTLRDDIRAEVESKKAVDRERALARENALSPHKKQKQATLFDRSPSKGKSPSKRGGVGPTIDAAGPPIPPPLGNNHKPSKPQQPPLPPPSPPPLPPSPPLRPRSSHNAVLDRNGKDVSSWLFAPKVRGGAGIDPVLFAYHSRAEQVSIIADQAKIREAFLRREVEERAEAARALEMQQNAVVIRSRRRFGTLRLSTMPEEVNSSDMHAVRRAIGDWVNSEEATEAEAGSEDDLQALRAFISAVAMDEGRLDKAMGLVQWFLSLCGVKDGWGRVCERLVDALQEAANAKGRGPVKL